MRITYLTVLFIILTLLVAACGAGETASTAPAPQPQEETAKTEATNADVASATPQEAAAGVTEAHDTATPASPFTPTVSPEPTATSTRVAKPSATPTSANTATPLPDPVVTLSDTITNRVNIRSGPGTDYPVVTQIEPGQEAAVIGRNADDSWWQIRFGVAEGWVYGELVSVDGNLAPIGIVEAAPPPPIATPVPEAVAAADPGATAGADVGDEASVPAASEPAVDDDPKTPEELADRLRCGEDFCVTFQELMPIWENGGCVGNHSIYITVLQGLPPGKPLDGVVIGDTFNNVEVGSGSHGPGRTEITLWNNSMTLVAKRHQDGTPYTSEESFNFTASDELIPPEVLAAAGYCDGSIDKCRIAHQNNQVCRGHYSWRVTFHKFD